MADARKLGIAELKEIVTDAQELAKGTRVFDDGGLSHLSRFEGKLFADAKGSGAAPYKVQAVFDDGKVRGRCSCMAARSRPFCKHSAALLAAWARAPEGFAVADVAPAAMASGDAKKKAVKKGKTNDADLMRHGVAQVVTLVGELAVAGVATLARDRVEQVRALGESLRESKLRRLSANTLDLAAKLHTATARAESFDAVEYADRLADLLLTARKLEKHLGGEALDDKYVEELIGKTWTKKDRRPIEGLELVEYAFTTRVTPDEFVIRESRFFCIATGEHYSEKQILPAFLAKRTEPKKSWAGRILRGAAGSLYPSFAPVRLDVESTGRIETLVSAAIQQVLARANRDVASALTAFGERKKDVFAPDTLPIAVAVETVLAEGARMQIVDASNAALFLPDDPAMEERLAAALRGVTLRGLLGDIAIDGALPTFVPLAAIVDTGRGHELRVLGGGDAAAALGGKKVKASVLPTPGGRSAWTDAARAAGASTAAIALGEVREELAQALANGLSGLGPRVTAPLASRLSELGLVKQADLLGAIAAKAEPLEKLDDFVKLYQVLGIALTRLSGATHVDRATLEAVPTYESVFIRRSDRELEPREIAALTASGKMSRYQAATHYARHYEKMPPEELAASIYPTWADGSASRYIARAFVNRPAQAIEAARRALGLARGVDASRRPPSARVASLTALGVLEAVGSPEAKKSLDEVMRSHSDAAIRAHAARALRVLAGDDAWHGPMAEELTRHRDALLSGSTKDDRIVAIRKLVALGHVEAIPFLRASFAGDVSGEVREQAAYALAQIGDVESVDTFVRMLRERGENQARAKVGAYSLGYLGDVRGVDELLVAYADGWQPAIVADAIRQIGTAALGPLVELLERRPEILERKAALGVIAALPAEDVKDHVLGRLGELEVTRDFAALAAVLVAVAGEHESIAKEVVEKVLALRPDLLGKRAKSAEEKLLARRCAKHLQGVKQIMSQ